MESGSTHSASSVLETKERTAAASTTSRISTSERAKLAQAVDIALADRRRVVCDVLRQVHHRPVDVVESGCTPIDDEVADDLGSETVLAQDLAVRERALAGAQFVGSRNGRELVAAWVHVLRDRDEQLTTCLFDVGQLRKEPRVVGDVSEPRPVGREQLRCLVRCAVVCDGLDEGRGSSRRTRSYVSASKVTT